MQGKNSANFVLFNTFRLGLIKTEHVICAHFPTLDQIVIKLAHATPTGELVTLEWIEMGRA